MFEKYASATLTNLVLKRGILHAEIHANGEMLMAGTFVMCADVLQDRAREALEVQAVENRARKLHEDKQKTIHYRRTV
jgi:hypothetical protein